MYCDIREYQENKPHPNPRPTGPKLVEFDPAIEINDPSLKTIVVHPEERQPPENQKHVGYLRGLPYFFQAVSFPYDFTLVNVQNLIPKEKVLWHTGERMTANGWPYAVLNPYACENKTVVSNTDGGILAGINCIFISIEGPVIFLRNKNFNL